MQITAGWEGGEPKHELERAQHGSKRIRVQVPPAYQGSRSGDRPLTAHQIEYEELEKECVWVTDQQCDENHRSATYTGLVKTGFAAQLAPVHARHGWGTLKYLNSTEETYRGQWRDGKKHGQGEFSQMLTILFGRFEHI